MAGHEVPGCHAPITKRADHRRMSPAAETPLLVEHFPAPRQSLRVAVVTETYPPEINGVALTLQRLVLALQARHHELQLVRPRQRSDAVAETGAGLHQVLVRGVPIPRYPDLRMGLPAKRSLLSLWSVQRPDLVHVATEGPLGWSALQAARKLRLPISSDFRTNFNAYSRHYGLGWLHKPIAGYLRKFHNLAGCTMVPTAGLRDALHGMGFERLNVVARGVDTEGFDPARRREALRRSWGATSDDPVVLYVGRLAAEKNLELLARAMAAMRRESPRLRCVVVGDGPERERLAALCTGAVWAGPRRGEDLAAHYASADLFLFPSLTETYGNVVPEAMASGLAVLAFDHAAAAELIRNGENGLLAPWGDAEAFVRQALALVRDPARAAVFGRLAREACLGQGWGRIAAQVEAVWVHLLRSHTQGTDAVQADGRRWRSAAPGT